MSRELVPSPVGEPEPTAYETLATQLELGGYAICSHFLLPEEAADLLDEAHQLWKEGEFRRASVGRGSDRQLRTEIRNDQVLWLDPLELTPSQSTYWSRMEELRETLNSQLFLGLFELEAHLARFPQGGYYKPHLDRHRDTQARVVSAVLYLDPGWTEDDGGQLRIYSDRVAGVQGPSFEILPEPGKLVLFLSGEIWHEVLPAHRPRHSLTGWFRCRAEGLT